MKSTNIKALLHAFLIGISLLSLNTRAGVEITYIYNDALGTPIAGADEQGNVKWRAHYQPYGEELLGERQLFGVRAGYTGQRADPETGLTYMGARYYSPALGRFMGVDPAGVSESNIYSFNRYAYANDNPYRYVDPDGRAPYLVSRPLDGRAGVIANHNFVVSNANSVGDPNATVYSYGENNSGNTGRVDANTKGFSKDTSETDQTFWKGLVNKSVADVQQSVTLINAPDATVDKNASSLVEDTDYAAFAGPFGTNSSSAASAVANKSEGKEVKLPNNGRLSPGASSADKIKFKP